MKWGSRLLANVAEVVAPSPKTPLESFKQHWMSIRNFYIDEKNDVDSGNIPTHLHSIVQILVEENDERPSSLGPETGLCTEFFIQNKLMETMCALCLIDKPAGVRKLVLAALNSILGNVRNVAMLIPHVAFHHPLATLISGMATMQLAGELVDALTLIKTCLGLIASEPMLGEFFVVVPSEGNAKGTKKKKNGKQPLLFSYSCVSGKTNAEYSIWTALTSLFKRTTHEQRERIEDLLLRAINSANGFVMDLLLRSEFHTRLVEELLGLFSHLPKVRRMTRICRVLFGFDWSVVFCRSCLRREAQKASRSIASSCTCASATR